MTNSDVLNQAVHLPGEMGMSDTQEIRDKLLLREAQLSQAQRMAGMASWEWYFGDTKIRWSPEMYLFWGYEPDEIEVDLDSVAQATHMDDLPILQAAVARALQGENVEMEYRRYDKFGREIFIHTIGRIIRNEQGEPLGVFGIDMNITKRKQQELHLAELNRQLAEKNRELEKRNAELNTFSYAASHDLQEPLRKIQMFNSLILDNEAERLSEQAKGYFGRSMAAAERMQRLIKNLITYAQTNTIVQERERVDLYGLVEQIELHFRDTIREKQARFDYESLPAVMVVAFMFRQLLQHLIGNALTYTRSNVPPLVRLTYETIAQELAPGKTTWLHKLSINDNGIGFNPAYNQKIFGLFQRLNSTSHSPDGTGIGLALCQRIMEHHGGTIVADGRPGQGATFTLYWPVPVGE